VSNTGLERDTPKAIFRAWLSSLPTADTASRKAESGEREKEWLDEIKEEPQPETTPTEEPTREKEWLDEGGGPPD
jgi:hypothetical protein